MYNEKHTFFASAGVLALQHNLPPAELATLAPSIEIFHCVAPKVKKHMSSCWVVLLKLFSGGLRRVSGHSLCNTHTHTHTHTHTLFVDANGEHSHHSSSFLQRHSPSKVFSLNFQNWIFSYPKGE